MTRALQGTVRLCVAMSLLTLASGLARANWVASGTFRYQDRPFSTTQFLPIVEMPIRFADIEVLDLSKAANKQVIAKGKTDASGSYSLTVVDSTTHAVRIRALTSTTQTLDLFVKVTYTPTGAVYALSPPDVPSHNPNTSVDFGIQVAPAFSGAGEAFNIFDLGVLGADQIKAITGSRPASTRLVTFRFDIADTSATSSTLGSTVTIRGTSGYDDTVILHEHGHYTGNNYWGSDNAGGSHALAECNQNILLAFDEGRASFWGCGVRRSNNLPICQFYFRSDTVSFLNSFDLEDALQYPCRYDTSEVAVSRTLWDIGDNTGTSDSTYGAEDAAGYDTLALNDLQWWEVMAGPARTATTISLEDFWDGWFDPAISNGYKPEMTNLFNNVDYGIQFFPDTNEPNQTSAQARPFTKGSTIHLTFFSDPESDGKGAADTDWFSFKGVLDTFIAIKTSNLINDANTKLELIDTNGHTVLASNDDRSPGDLSSLINWFAPRSDLFYVKVTNVNANGIYGSYDLTLTSPPTLP